MKSCSSIKHITLHLFSKHKACSSSSSIHDSQKYKNIVLLSLKINSDMLNELYLIPVHKSKGCKNCICIQSFSYISCTVRGLSIKTLSLTVKEESSQKMHLQRETVCHLCTNSLNTRGVMCRQQITKTDQIHFQLYLWHQRGCGKY